MLKNNIFLKKIISGGQNGADIAGLKAAKRLNIPTGGWMPRNFRTESGEKPEYEKLYGIKTTKSYGYSERTRKNIQESDGTAIFCYNRNSPGTALTIKICQELQKPYAIYQHPYFLSKLSFCDWLNINNIYILNIAGNREKNGFESLVEEFLIRNLLCLKS